MEVFVAFAGLGLRCFGGPAAHLGYFRAEFVGRRRWLDERQFADLVGLCQFLPGPASSQTGFAVGLLRAGLPGGIAAWAGFTLPSALLMLGFAFGAPALDGSRPGAGLLHGLKLAAIAVVAQAVWSMARSLCRDWLHAAIAAGAVLLLLLAPVPAAQFAAIGLGAAAGLALSGRSDAAPPRRREVAAFVGMSRRGAAGCLALFAALLFGPPLLDAGHPLLMRLHAFYRAGALVFGGGHVVLPLLRQAVVAPGWVPEGRFLAGYGAAQAVPGPLFSFAAYLGASMSGATPRLAGAALALLAIFLPGLLLVAGILPLWDRLRHRPRIGAAMRGANAATVGILAACLHDPLWTGAVHGLSDAVLAGAGFVLLSVWRSPPLLVIVFSAVGGICFEP